MANHPSEVLVITDYFWIGTALPGATCATAIINSRNVNNFYFSSTALADGAGIAAKTEHFTTGMTLTGNPLITQGKTSAPTLRAVTSRHQCNSRVT